MTFDVYTVSALILLVVESAFYTLFICLINGLKKHRLKLFGLLILPTVLCSLLPFTFWRCFLLIIAIFLIIRVLYKVHVSNLLVVSVAVFTLPGANSASKIIHNDLIAPLFFGKGNILYIKDFGYAVLDTVNIGLYHSLATVFNILFLLVVLVMLWTLGKLTGWKCVNNEG
jgi:hypothetical protein